MDTEIMSTYVQPIEKKSLIHMALWWLFPNLHTDYDKNDNLKPVNLTYLKWHNNFKEINNIL